MEQNTKITAQFENKIKEIENDMRFMEKDLIKCK